VQAAGDFAPFKHRFFLPDFTRRVKREGRLTPGCRFIKM